ncbi:MAG TPA: molybdenum cofactor guanylyltransferase [Sphingomonadaceae bacterium]|nr:molybdenum cofactor guanylyltransferase [Sphingomonadaceae bacterium]
MVLAGGQSSRFGSDKALAELAGRTLLSRAVDALSGMCEHVVIAGRETGPAPCIPDWPHAGMGPLGGIAAGLHHALDADFESVLTCGVDSPDLPDDLLELLSPPPCYLADQPVIGHWPARAANRLETLLESQERHSMLAFAEAIGAKAVKSCRKPANINTQADLTAMEIRNGI